MATPSGFNTGSHHFPWRVRIPTGNSCTHFNKKNECNVLPMKYIKWLQTNEVKSKWSLESLMLKSKLSCRLFLILSSQVWRHQNHEWCLTGVQVVPSPHLYNRVWFCIMLWIHTHTDAYTSIEPGNRIRVCVCRLWQGVCASLLLSQIRLSVTLTSQGC